MHSVSILVLAPMINVDQASSASGSPHSLSLSRQDISFFESAQAIAPPEKPDTLVMELAGGELLGTTRDGNDIYLLELDAHSALLREIGRMREIAFRKAGEGTGLSRDTDAYDLYYRHLLLWDRSRQQIAGAYRLGLGSEILYQRGESGFYTHSLYEFTPAFHTFLHYGLELGRSFVNPDYWGKASLDYLWQGLGAYLKSTPQIRYLIGPVSMSARYPRFLMDELVFYYSKYYSSLMPLVLARSPHKLTMEDRLRFETIYNGHCRETGFERLQESFMGAGHRIPVMYRQYASLFEEGGFQVLLYNIDRNFGDCLDGLCMADLTYLKAIKRKRYIAAS